MCIRDSTEAAEAYEKAAFYWGKVGETASQNGAYSEAEKNLLHGIELLKKLPEVQSTLKKKIELLVLLGSVRITTHGQTADTVRDLYLEAQIIAEKIEEDIPHKAIVAFGLSAYHFFSGSLTNTQKFALDALEIARRMKDEQSQIQAHLMLANSSFWMGDFKKERLHVEEIWQLYKHENFERHLSHFAQNPKITSAIGEVWAQCLLGYPDQAMALSEETMLFATEMNHQYSIAMCYQIKAFMHYLRKEPSEAEKYGKRLIQISKDEGFPMFISMGQSIIGWSVAVQGDFEAGIVQIQSGLDLWGQLKAKLGTCLLYTSPSPRDATLSRMPSSA